MLVQHTRATFTREKAISVVKKTFKEVLIDIIKEEVAYFFGIDVESNGIQFLLTVIDGVMSVIDGAMPGIATGNIISAVIGGVYGGAKWLLWDKLFNTLFFNTVYQLL